jgi:HD-GYP domain-containing protein (c-di-GMP phosphodiesterase class II)
MDNLKNFISTLMAAISNCALYSKDHASLDEFIVNSLKFLEKFLKESDKLVIMLIEDDLIINKSPAKDIGLQCNNLKKRLIGKGLSYIEFLPGVTYNEIKQLIPEILETDKKMSLFTHIKTGVLNIRLEDAKTEEVFDINNIPDFISKQIEIVKEICKNISSAQQINILRLNQVIGNFLSAFKKKVNVVELLSNAKSREEYSYFHATNVSVLSIFQIRTLGVKDGTFLRDIGMAGLLHDAGKLFISSETLGKKSSLEKNDWETIKLHPLLGARFLSSLKGLPPLVPVVAFEHHLKYDGKGYPERKVYYEKQHICSQVVAISDCFDALRSTRPYRKGLEIRELLPIMEKDSGHAFNPFLLENFMCRMNKALHDFCCL